MSDKPKLGPFTPAIDAIVKRYDYVTALVFGIVWRNCQKENKCCYAKPETMAKQIGVCRQTVWRKLDLLKDDGLIYDHTPGLRNVAHTYTITSLGYELAGSGADSDQEISVAQSNTSVAESNSTVAQSNTSVAESNSQCCTELHEESIKDTLQETEVEESSSSKDTCAQEAPAAAAAAEISLEAVANILQRARTKWTTIWPEEERRFGLHPVKASLKPNQLVLQVKSEDDIAWLSANLNGQMEATIKEICGIEFNIELEAALSYPSASEGKRRRRENRLTG